MSRDMKKTVYIVTNEEAIKRWMGQFTARRLTSEGYNSDNDDDDDDDDDDGAS